MKKRILFALTMLLSVRAFASATRTLDGQQVTNGSAVLTLPTTTDTLVGRSTTDTLTNKTLTSPAITTPTGIVKGDVGLGNVDNTSDATKNSATATLTNKTISGATNTISNVPAATALTGSVPIANGGTGATTQQGALNALLPSQTAGFYLTSDGTNASFAAIPMSAPTLVGTKASPIAVTAAGGLTVPAGTLNVLAFIQGSGGAVTVSASPQISGCSTAGQRLVVIGESATNTVTLADGNGLSLNGQWVAGLNSALTLVCDSSVWVEVSRR